MHLIRKTQLNSSANLISKSKTKKNISSEIESIKERIEKLNEEQTGEFLDGEIGFKKHQNLIFFKFITILHHERHIKQYAIERDAHNFLLHA